MVFIVTLKDCIKSSHFANTFRLLARPLFWLKYQKSDFCGWLRRKGLSKPSRLQYLKKWKLSHKGETCFVVATGPSLTFEDLDAIADARIFCFGMNSCVLALDKTRWKPDILGIEDEFVYKKIEKQLVEASHNKFKGKIWVSDLLASIFKSARNFYIYPHHYLDHKYDPNKILELKFSDDLYVNVYDGYSIALSLMQLAVYMGFKRICLIGSDCNYKQAKKNFIEHGANVKFEANDIAGTRIIAAHSKFKEFADQHKVQVINCTRGGMLEVYTRKSLEEIISEEIKK